MTRVFLVRHGATAANRAVPYRLQGRHADLPLDPLGVAQARRTAALLADRGLVAVYTSPLARAIETARWVARPLGLEPIPVAALTEADLGRWEGLSWDEVRAADPELFHQFMARPGTVPYPGGESFLDVQRRVTPVVAGLAGQHPGTPIAIVGHNVVNRAYLAGLIGLSIDRARALRQANGGVNLILFHETTPELITLNACFHLEGIDESL